MKRVLITQTLLDAQLAIDALASLGIQAHLFNAHASGAMGELPFLHAQPEVWVDDAADAERARDVLSTLEHAPARAEKTCPQCGEINPGNFLSCWQCGQALAD